MTEEDGKIDDIRGNGGDDGKTGSDNASAAQ